MYGPAEGMDKLPGVWAEHLPLHAAVSGCPATQPHLGLRSLPAPFGAHTKPPCVTLHVTEALSHHKVF